MIRGSADCVLHRYCDRDCNGCNRCIALPGEECTCPDYDYDDSAAFDYDEDDGE